MSQPCYICKRPIAASHPDYPALCQPCGALNAARRDARMDLAGRIALVTGGRVKIGHATALRLLRAGAQVIITTRFPQDAALRFYAEVDFPDFAPRLTIHPLDLRALPAVEGFAAHLSATLPHLDILINNAAQTIWHPPAYYADLLAAEADPAALPPAARPLVRALPGSPATPDPVTALHPDAPFPLLTATDRDDFPPDAYDAFGDQVDRRAANSWTLMLEDVPLRELLETQIINVTAPFLLIARLAPLLRRSPHQARFIINVTSAEGQFTGTKSGPHPHTNMAKAALNMLTRTAAGPLADDGIYLNAVDPGFVSPQLPYSWEGEPVMPLAMADAAARVCDPIARGLVGDPTSGHCFKHYAQTAW